MQAITIRDIVETYENLSERQREKIIRIAEHNIKEQGITGFDSQYKYVGRLVEDFQQPWEERFALKLDAPPREGYNHPLIDSFFYGQNTYEVEHLFMGISLDIVAQLSEKFFDGRERELIHKLLNRSNGEEGIHFTHDEIVSGIPLTKRRLETLVRLLEEDIRFQQPERQIVYVNLSPDNPWIQWKRRRYNKWPIDFFRKHIDIYGRFVEEGRKALQRFDSGLFNALRDNTLEIDKRTVRQIGLAIPKLKPRGNLGHNENIIKQIVLAYEYFDGNVSRASKTLPYSRATITKYWRTAGLKIKSHRNGDFISKISDKEREQIIEAHGIYSKSAYQAARDLPYHKSTILRYWKQAGLPILKQKRRRVNH